MYMQRCLYTEYMSNIIYLLPIYVYIYIHIVSRHVYGYTKVFDGDSDPGLKDQYDSPVHNV